MSDGRKDASDMAERRTTHRMKQENKKDGKKPASKSAVLGPVSANERFVDITTHRRHSPALFDRTHYLLSFNFLKSEFTSSQI
jgi:hypothetical protein